jgi:hypothetical protein
MFIIFQIKLTLYLNRQDAKIAKEEKTLIKFFQLFLSLLGVPGVLAVQFLSFLCFQQKQKVFLTFPRSPNTGPLFHFERGSK